MINPYKDYLVTKYKYDGAIELDGSFLLYRIAGDSLNVGELYVHPDHRQNGVGTELAREVEQLAKEMGLKRLTCQIEITGTGEEMSLMGILKFGFKLSTTGPGYGVCNGTVGLYKEIQ